MARVKRGVTAHAKHKKVFKAAKGYYGRRKNTIRIAKQAVEKANQYAFRDRKRQQAHLPRAVDPAPQCGGARVRPDLQSVYRRPRQGRDHGRSQGAVRSRDPRAGGVPDDRREGQGRACGVRLPGRTRAVVARPIASLPDAAGRVPAIRERFAWRCRPERDTRQKTGHDGRRTSAYNVAPFHLV